MLCLAKSCTVISKHLALHIGVLAGAVVCLQSFDGQPSVWVHTCNVYSRSSCSPPPPIPSGVDNIYIYTPITKHSSLGAYMQSDPCVTRLIGQFIIKSFIPYLFFDIKSYLQLIVKKKAISLGRFHESLVGSLKLKLFHFPFVLFSVWPTNRCVGENFFQSWLKICPIYYMINTSLCPPWESHKNVDCLCLLGDISQPIGTTEFKLYIGRQNSKNYGKIKANIKLQSDSTESLNSSTLDSLTWRPRVFKLFMHQLIEITFTVVIF